MADMVKREGEELDRSRKEYEDKYLIKNAGDQALQSADFDPTGLIGGGIMQMAAKKALKAIASRLGSKASNAIVSKIKESNSPAAKKDSKKGGDYSLGSGKDKSKVQVEKRPEYPMQKADGTIDYDKKRYLDAVKQWDKKNEAASPTLNYNEIKTRKWHKLD